MTRQEALAKQDEFYMAVKLAGAILRGFQKGELGLTTDAAKASPNYKRAKALFDKAFGELQEFNKHYARLIHGR